MYNKLKSQKGITGIDLSISLIIIMLFVSIIVAISMNVSSSLASKRRIDVASNCMVEIIEKLDSISYDKIIISETESENTIDDVRTSENPDDFETAIKNILINNEEYSILNVGIVKKEYVPEGYTPDIPDEEPPSLLKQITIMITYNINDVDESIEVTRLKPRYNVDLMENVTSVTE